MIQNTTSLYFTAPGKVELREEALPTIQAGQVRVRTLLSAISPGTELLVYRGQFPSDLAVDESIGALAGAFRYPLRYGYSAVGQVEALGPGADPARLGRLLFALQPHTSHFLAATQELHALPEGVSAQDAVFLPNMETAVNFVMDGAPLIGEQVAVFGQGIVGLLTTALLAQFPLTSLVAVDRYPLRRQFSLELGASAALDPSDERLPHHFADLQPDGADLVYELTGAPEALDQAIAAAGFAGRVVIGSWYGRKRVSLDLGGRFHRSRMRLISSQVSTLAPEHSGRWDKARRFSLAWEMLGRIRPSRLISRRIPLAQAAEAYRLLDESPGEVVQVVLEY
jgi:alcohol dehydrogenase